MKKLLNIILSKMRLIIGREESVRKKINSDYLEAIWCDKLQPIFFVESIITCDFFANKFCGEKLHTYVKTLLHYKNYNENKYVNSELNNYYDTFQPENTLEVFGINKKTKQSKSKGLFEFLLPWDTKVYKKQNNKQLMYSGPIEKKRGEYEFQRLLKVYLSILKNGYIPQKSSNLFNSNHIQGYFLRKNNDYRFIILHGKHRAATLSVLGYKHFPVTFELGKPRVIELTNIEEWPQVRNGTYSVQHATEIFNKFFE